MILTDIPGEIVAHIAHLLRRSELLTFRLVCKQLRDQSDTIFLNTFFSSVKTDLCAASLQRLRRIANNNTIRLHIRQIILCQHENRHAVQHEAHELPTLVDSSLSANAVLDNFANMLSRFPNLARFCVRDDIKNSASSSREIIHAFTNCLCLLEMNTVHLVLVALARSSVPLKSFRMWHGAFGFSDVGRPLPQPIALLLSPAWATHLVDLGLEWNPHNHPSVTPLVELVVHAKSLRSLQLANAPTELLRGLVDALDPGESEELNMTSLERLELVNTKWDLRMEDLIAFIARFQTSLQHLYLNSVRLEGADWRVILSGWASELLGLKSLGFYRLQHVVTVLESAKTLTFNDLLDWEGAPFGELEVNLKSGTSVIGVKYCGEGAGEVLTRMAEIGTEVTLGASNLLTSRDSKGWLHDGYLVGGRLKARPAKLPPLYPDVLGSNQPRMPHPWLKRI